MSIAGAISQMTPISAPTGLELYPAVYNGTAANYNITGNVFRTWLLASSALTGVPTAPTAAQNTNTTQVASTAFVLGQATSATPLMDGTAAVGTTTLFARGDHVHPTDTTRAASGANSDITSLSGLTTPLSVAQGGSGSASGLSLADGQVRLSVSSSTVLALSPFQGGNIVINGVLRTINSTITVTPALAASTLYFVYAASDAPPAVTIEISTTGFVTDAYGRSNKSGDATRRLVGVVYTNASAQFVDSPAQRGCLNYFNRRLIYSSLSISNVTTASTSYIQIGGSLAVLSWLDEVAQVRFDGAVSNNTSTTTTYTNLTFGGSAIGYATSIYTPAANALLNPSLGAATVPATYASSSYLLGQVSAGTGTWNGVLGVVVRG